jgi:beta-phosphoglucomutase family hydrolase
MSVDWSSTGAALFDLDGVITPTAEVHMRAWGEMFDEFLARPEAAENAVPGAIADTEPWSDADYFDHVDGKPRFDGVRDFLAARLIALPEGQDDDAPTVLTVRGLGNRKNQAFNDVLTRDGVHPYPGSVALLDHLRDAGLPLAVVSSSRNAPAVLKAAGLDDRFVTAAELGLPGKPAPDMFTHAAQTLGVPSAQCVVIEDALSGVRAGAAGGFHTVVGVDRGVGVEVLRRAGADLVVADLLELIPDAEVREVPVEVGA